MRTDEIDALLVMSFGGPEAPEEVLPFLRRVVAGRGVPDERLEQVAEQYRHFGGVSPLNAENRDLVARLAERAPQIWAGQRVYLGNRNSEPFVADTLMQMARDGVRTAAVFITSAFSSYSGCRQYRENLAAGLAESGADIRLQVLPRFHDHPLLAQIWADRLAAADPTAPGTRVVFVTHSLPVAAAAKYAPQHRALAAQIAGGAMPLTPVPDWVMAYQSRSGPPSQPWLEPDIAEVVADAARDGVSRLIVAPIGFCAENLEIRWDLDVTAAEAAAVAGIGFVRLDPPQRDPRIVDLVYDLVQRGDGVPCRVGCCRNPRADLPAVGERADG
jgi:ferrochelatase